jgi:hypothetical protein
MALAWFRLSSRIIALVLLASFWGLSHRGGDDACLKGALQSHDGAQHAIGAPDGGAPDHCAVCHSIRTPKRPAGSAGYLHSALVQGSIVDAPETSSRREPALDKLPARAPPASLT